jgi:hypothetical protein
MILAAKGLDIREPRFSRRQPDGRGTEPRHQQCDLQ